MPNALVLQVDVPAVDGGLGNASLQGSVLLSVTEQQSLFIANALANSSGGQSSNNIWLAVVGASGATYQPVTVPALPGKFPNHGFPPSRGDGPMHDLIRVSLQGDDASLRDLFERSGMVEIVDATPDVLVWNLPHDADGLPAEMRIALADAHGPAIVALTDTHPSRWFDEALALGVDEVLCLPQSPESLGMAAAKATRDARPPGDRRRDRADRWPRATAPRTCSPCSRPRAAPARP